MNTPNASKRKPNSSSFSHSTTGVEPPSRQVKLWSIQEVRGGFYIRFHDGATAPYRFGSRKEPEWFVTEHNKQFVSGSSKVGGGTAHGQIER